MSSVRVNTSCLCGYASVSHSCELLNIPGLSMEHSGRSHDGGGRLTVPKTPNFETRRRFRANTAVSQSDREEMELQEAKK